MRRLLLLFALLLPVAGNVEAQSYNACYVWYGDCIMNARSSPWGTFYWTASCYDGIHHGYGSNASFSSFCGSGDGLPLYYNVAWA